MNVKGIVVGFLVGAGVGFAIGYVFADNYTVEVRDDDEKDDSPEVETTDESLFTNPFDGGVIKTEGLYSRVETTDVRQLRENKEEVNHVVSFLNYVSPSPSEIDEKDVPYVIDYEEYSNEHNEYDKIDAYYLQGYNMVVCDDEMVDNADVLVGVDVMSYLENCVTSSFDKDGDYPIFVRNDSYGCDFEIHIMSKDEASAYLGNEE